MESLAFTYFALATPENCPELQGSWSMAQIKPFLYTTSTVLLLMALEGRSWALDPLSFASMVQPEKGASSSTIHFSALVPTTSDPPVSFSALITPPSTTPEHLTSGFQSTPPTFTPQPLTQSQGEKPLPTLSTPTPSPFEEKTYGAYSRPYYSRTTLPENLKITPFRLVYRAYQGGLKDLDIPSYAALVRAYRRGKLLPQDLMKAAILQGRLTSKDLYDEHYIQAVAMHLKNLF